MLPLYFHWGTNLEGLVAKNDTASTLAALALEHKTSIEAAQGCLVGVHSRHHRSVGLDCHQAPLQGQHLLERHRAMGLVTDHDCNLAVLLGSLNQGSGISHRHATHIHQHGDWGEATGGLSHRSAQLGAPDHPCGSQEHRNSGADVNKAPGASFCCRALVALGSHRQGLRLAKCTEAGRLDPVQVGPQGASCAGLQ